MEDGTLLSLFGYAHSLSVHHVGACDNSSAVHKDEYVHDWLLSTGSSALDSALHFHDDIFSNIPTFQEDALTYNEHIVKPLSHFHIQNHLRHVHFSMWNFWNFLSFINDTTSTMDTIFLHKMINKISSEYFLGD